MEILHIFIKNPRLGYVKTRLAATVGADKALEIYQQLMCETMASSLACAADKWLWYSDEVDKDDLWDNAIYEKKIQPRGDLGQRMRGAFEQSFKDGALKAVIIGSDCPEITPTLLDEAFRALEDTDFVIGPTFDGGYYLLGMRYFHPEVFEDIAWSTETVCASTLAIIERAGLSCTQLERLNDIDQEEDWDRWRGRNAGVYTERR